MTKSNLDALNTFDLDNVPDLDIATLGALELFEGTALPAVDFSQFKRPIVIGSLNAAITGEIFFDGQDVVFADESDFEAKIDAIPEIDGAVLFSASGSKHAVLI